MIRRDIKIMAQKNALVFLKRQRPFSRTDMVWILKILAINVYKLEMLPKTFSDHNPVTSTFKKKNGSFRWRLNEKLLQKETVVEDCEKKLKGFS